MRVESLIEVTLPFCVIFRIDKNAQKSHCMALGVKLIFGINSDIVLLDGWSYN